MTQLARLAVALLITIVAMWSVAQVAGATTMSLEMASAAPGDEMADLSISQDVRSVPAIATHVAAPVHVLAGQTFPPDLHPPRALPLI